MSRGFDTRKVPLWVAQGIESAFLEWKELSGQWLHTAPEYHLIVSVAQRLRKTIPKSQRTVLMEPAVKRTLKAAGGVQCGRKADGLRNNGRFDIVLGHADARPRVVIELKNPVWEPTLHAVYKDLRRIGHTLLHGPDKTHFQSGVFGFFTSSAAPKRGNETAGERLCRKFAGDWSSELKEWGWAESHHRKAFREKLLIEVGARVYAVPQRSGEEAWAAVCVEMRRRPRPRIRIGD